MTWNYRVVSRTYPDRNRKPFASDAVEVQLGIYEVYYAEDGVTPKMVTTDPVGFVAESIDDLRKVLGWALKALDKPILDYDKDFHE